MILGSTFPRLRNRIPFHFKPLNFRRHGAFLGSNLFFFVKKNIFFGLMKNFFRKFRILESQEWNFLVEEYFWSTSKKDCDTKSATWFGLVTILSPKTHRSRVFAPKALFFGYSVRIFWVWLCPHDSRGHSLCDLCFIQKLSFLRGQLPIRQTLWISRLFS